MNSTLYNSNFHHGIRHYKCVFYMIFIHKLKNWSVKKLFNFISNLTNSFFNIIFSIVRKFSPLYDSYFIIKEMLSIRKIKSFFNIPRDFYSCHLHSSSSFFNLCSSWNINGWNSERRDEIMYLNSVIEP
ncbi:hypothetical protein H8356DRAFT_1619838, partial [Neocallimastix lanati (nom. inval.)]